MTQTLICQKCKDEVLKIVEEHAQKHDEEITRLSLSSSGDDMLLSHVRKIVLIGIKSVKYRIGDMWVKKEDKK